MEDDLEHDIVHLIAKSPRLDTEAVFDALALQIFQHQYSHNLPYRRFCISKGLSPASVQSWEEIPLLPVLAFKWADITCFPKDQASRIFYSSGTTEAGKSRHFLFNRVVARAAILSHFKRHVLPDYDQMRMMILTPSPEEDPHASLSYMMSVVCEMFGASESSYYIRGGVLQGAALARALDSADGPVLLIGTSFSFVHCIDYFKKQGLRLSLPPRSRLMDTGGLKGKSREVPQGWIYGMAEQYFGILPEYCVNEYGMSEMTSQFYDHVAGQTGPRVYVLPPQVRTRVLSPDNLEPVSDGETGLLAHVDLANYGSVSALLTEDLGRKVAGGFILEGRASGAARKGCSITLDTLLENGGVKHNLLEKDL